MCNCGSDKEKINTYQPMYRQVWTKDRLGRPILTRVPIIPPKIRRQLKRLRQEYIQKKNANTLEQQIDLALKI